MDRRKFLTISGTVVTVATAGCIDTVSTGGDQPQQHVENPDMELVFGHGPDQQWEYEWFGDRLEIQIGQKDPDPDTVEGENTVSSSVWFAAGPYDMSSISKVYYEFRHTSEPGTGLEEHAGQDYSFLTVVSDLDKLGVHAQRDFHITTDPDDEINASHMVNDQIDTGEETEALDVSWIEQPRFFGFGGNVGAVTPQIMQLDIYDIYGVNSDGERVFELDHNEERLMTL